ncbi:hypothetical protein roselon_01995 [Roseibacterium elongatum DSM 19469]|uniref:DUF2726 domain-containing protein n=1 Tax=Roseicyclus elongatus DSM 19469 TaxID=1294273 RepID=W8RT71_9RHOB|nr:DUF2726 domain-containing protein [Roseibacterium elongatum]AHM04348.1 hypothetical protein roselon_01995 [Roseibacterium elongatum DSM 19469]
MLDLSDLHIAIPLAVSGAALVVALVVPKRRLRAHGKRTGRRADIAAWRIGHARKTPVPKSGARRVPASAKPSEGRGIPPVSQRPVLNRSEERVFAQLEHLVERNIMGHVLLAQVSMGEFLAIRRKGRSYGAWTSDFNRINAKRVDFLIVDPSWNPVLVIEYQGAGHYGPDGARKLRRDAEKRDAIKRMMCHAAGSGFMEVMASGLNEAQLAEINALFRPPNWQADL